MGGGVNLLRLKNNSGGAGIPRNLGIKFSRGEYVFFVDSDDVIMKDALEKVYTVAEKFKADVVHSGTCYKSSGETASLDKNILKIYRPENTPLPEKPLLESEDLAERVKNFVENKIWWVPWNYLIRRDLLVYNDIKFPAVSPSDDFVFKFLVTCVAKKFVRIPDTFYVWREREGSTSRPSKTAEKHLIQWLKPLPGHIKALDKFMSDFELFRKQPEYKYAVFDFLFKIHVEQILPFYEKIHASQLDDIIRRVFADDEENSAFVAFVFNRMNVFQYNLFQIYSQIKS